MPGVFCWPVSQIVDQVEKWIISGIRAFAVFPKIDPAKKTETGDECLNPNSVVYEVARSIKSNFSQISLIGDLALDPYTSHGHDGVLDKDGRVDNDRTVEILAKASVLAADAGYDVLAPSDMMDGRVGVIRSHLEKWSYQNLHHVLRRQVLLFLLRTVSRCNWCIKQYAH